METDPLLSLATDEEIWEELKRRHKHVLLSWTSAAANGDPDQRDPFNVVWSGGTIGAIGLASASRRHLENELLGLNGDDDGE